MSGPTNELSELKEQFLASLNYEIRTPLTGILGMLDLLLETSLTEEQKEFADASRLCAENLLEIMNATLEYSALSANQIKLEEDEFPLRQVLDGLVDDFVFKAKTKGLALVRKFDDNLPEMVVGDAFRLKQLLAHLVENAVKFTSRGGVEVSAGSAVLEGGDVFLTASVRDTGVGIRADALERIFESFQQEEAGLSRRFTGMGLGLAVTQKLAQLMKAKVSVASEPGVGSTFSVRIPLRLPAEPRLKRRSTELAGLRILVVEDCEASHSSALKGSVPRTYQVDSVGSGTAAVSVAERQHYDLILMDLQMQGLDGLRLSSALRGLRGYADVPILAMTANCSLDAFDLCSRHGMQGFLAKPVQSSDLLRTLETFLHPGPASTQSGALTSRIAV